ncbi:MAG: TetR/AcrR family transcriptional regulator [Actinomycetota bacterium]
MDAPWGRHDRPEPATDRLVDAANRLYLRNGFDHTTMAQVATEAGCSRATLYNYFPSKADLRTAIRNRAAIEIAAATADHVAAIDEPAERITEAIVFAVDRVRGNPELAMWFTAEDVGLTSMLAGESDVIEAIAATFIGGPDGDDDLAHLRARLVVRLILSLLAHPEPDPAEERRLVGQVVAPALAPTR